MSLSGSEPEVPLSMGAAKGDEAPIPRVCMNASRVGLLSIGVLTEGKGIDGSAPMMTMVTKPPDKSPWTRTILLLTDSSLEDQSRIQDGDKMLISLGITQKTASSILSL